MAGPDARFWEQRFAAGQLPWDRGAPGPHLLRWLADGTVPAAGRVVVPGCGSGHDVEALAVAGRAVIGVDYAPSAVAQTRERLRAAGRTGDVVQADVLAWQPPAPLDVVYEQTCWCALHPDHWGTYAAQLHRWLRPGGRLLMMVMQAPRAGAAEGRIEGPPYHTDIHVVRALLPSAGWDWPAPPYPAVPHPAGWNELAVALVRR